MSFKVIAKIAATTAMATLAADAVRKIASKLRLPQGYVTMLTYKNGTLFVSGDSIRQRTIHEIQEALNEASSDDGSIRIRQDGRVVFSGIGDHLHQRVRNLLFNL